MTQKFGFIISCLSLCISFIILLYGNNLLGSLKKELDLTKQQTEELKSQLAESKKNQSGLAITFTEKEKRAKDPVIQRLFSPFLTPGYSNERGSKIERPRLYSLNQLTRHRRLKNVKKFSKFASSACGGRPSWTYPSTEKEWKEYEKRFEIFKELAPIWVNMELLLP